VQWVVVAVETDLSVSIQRCIIQLPHLAQRALIFPCCISTYRYRWAVSMLL
jgi:hypothetical protein